MVSLPFDHRPIGITALLPMFAACASVVGPAGGSDAATTDAQPVDSGSRATISAIDIAAGESHTCIVTRNGSVACWGDNSQGQLGDGTTVVRAAPVAVVGIDDALQVVAGWSHVCVRRASGRVACWGGGNATPTPVAGLEHVVDLASGSEHACARTDSGETFCWGRDTEGQLGDGLNTPYRAMPVATLYGLRAVEISGGSEHTCARFDAGFVRCWGANFVGELGNGTTTQVHGAAVVEGLDDAREVRSFAYTTCARRASGAVRCWGIGLEGELGDGSGTPSQPRPVEVTGLIDATSVGVGFRHACAVRAGGSVVCWGDNRGGQLGDGSTVTRRAPVAVSTLDDAVRVVAGGTHSCALRRSGAIACWGANENRQLGDGTTVSRATPVGVLGL